MIIVCLVIVTLIAYFGGVYVDNRHAANITRGICDALIVVILTLIVANRSEERRVGKAFRSRWSPDK